MQNSRTSNALKNSGASLMNKLAQTILQFAMRTAFIRLLGNEYTGISGLFTDILQVLSLMELGLDTSMVYSLYRPVAQNDTKRISALMNFYRKAFTIIGVTVLAAGALCTPFLGHIVKNVPNIREDIRGIFLMYVATTAFSYFLVYRTILIRANQQSRIISNYTTVVYIAESIVEIMLLFVFRQFYAYLIVHFLATVVRNILLSRKAKAMYPEYLRKSDERLSRMDRNKLMRDLACLTVYSTAGVVIYSTDSIFISAFVGTVEVAIIGNFSLIINSIRTLLERIVSATKPSIGNRAATSSTGKQEQIFDRMNFICFCCACFACTCFFTLLNPFVGGIWFNESYRTSLAIIATMVVNFFIAVMVYPVESFRTANGLFIQGWFRPAIMAVLNIVLDFFMGKLWGIFGIFLATTISRVLTQVWFDPYLVYKHVFKEKVWHYYKEYVIYFFLTAASCAIAHLICEALAVPGKYLNFVIRAAVSAVVPVLLIFALYRKDEKLSSILRIAGRMIHRRR